MEEMPTKTEKSKIVSCFHCGENCDDEAIMCDEKNFCCTGCLTVYEVLNDNNLCDYYAIEASPGSNQKKKEIRDNRFDYLEDEDVINRLIDFKDDEQSHVTFSIPMIHCASCIWLLENLYKLEPGVTFSRVDFIKKKVQIKYLSKETSLKSIVKLLSHIGYEPRINLSDLGEEKSHKTNKKLIYQLAVAGFCFGNMMFFSLPEYFSETELLGNGFSHLFNYLNIILALPVVFYSATDYFRSAWIAIRNRSVNMDVPIALGIISLFSYSLFEIFISGQEGYLDTLGGLLFFLLVGKYYQQKTFDTLSFDRDYKAYFPIAITKMIKDREQVIPLTKLNVGDIIKVRNEELVPADSILLESEASIDYSFVTGEEIPIPVKKGELIYAGGRQKGAAITLAVQKSPSQGYLTDLWNNEAFSKDEQEDSLASMANRISGKFTFTVLLIAFGALLYWSFNDISLGVRAFTSVLIITCPCALAMSTPFTLGNVMRIFGKGGFYLKNTQVIEKLAGINTLVFDKTGTLTAPSKARVSYHGENLTEESKSMVKALVNFSVHPLSNSINQWSGNVKPVTLDNVEEIPGKGLQASYKSKSISLGSALFLGVGSIDKVNNIGNEVHLVIDGMHWGVFRIASSVREGIEKMVPELAKSYDIHLLSGDHNHEEDYLKQVLGENVSMHFQQSPKSKLAHIRRMENTGKHVLMVGDGLNDAGALKASEVGIAVTDNISHFSPASDAILDGKKLSYLPDYLDFAKTGRKIIKASFGLSFTYNAVGVFFAVQGLVSPVLCAILMPASSISVVLFTTIATNFQAYRKGLNDKEMILWK
ncbi:heavy metal translocating P-type ATPase metal-binding domain-containing protein [Cyclobacterium sp. 1_MG-2023]|uniref:heavy metal translocating P-type ATPase n=1 Tax=Cyclobacterium sp. 1_MG-2023 TaxID=3062681 RepID=UPI0026E39B0A|nr:heavy metal translocating P-type ATPase metal-binding domain-containing protein [Cyclobacterium sp. 1_MG-2023]MDO6436699.1 heavy metal translocating P-type ATPase metal-binding domain-containing protein [Cyclobacterium sp. 1_MG-2023]